MDFPDYSRASTDNYDYSSEGFQQHGQAYTSSASAHYDTGHHHSMPDYQHGFYSTFPYANFSATYNQQVPSYLSGNHMFADYMSQSRAQVATEVQPSDPQATSSELTYAICSRHSLM
jgi:hypothetical protein